MKFFNSETLVAIIVAGSMVLETTHATGLPHIEVEIFPPLPICGETISIA